MLDNDTILLMLSKIGQPIPISEFIQQSKSYGFYEDSQRIKTIFGLLKLYGLIDSKLGEFDTPFFYLTDKGEQRVDVILKQMET